MKEKLRVVKSELPDPPYPADTCTKGWRFELDLQRVWRSDTWALCPADIRPWLYQIWAVAFEQTPAGSMPDDDALIAAHIGMDARLFQANRDYLVRGFRRHSDGRLYHPVVSERVLALIGYRVKEAERKAAYRARMQETKKCPTGQTRDGRGSPVGVTAQEQEQELEQELDKRILVHTNVCMSPDTSGNDRGPACPHKKIIELYHELCPRMSRIRTWEGQRPKHLQSRWRSHPDLEWWRGFLQYAGESDFLNGQNKNGWRASLHWMIRPENFQKISEGEYHR